jgi:DNA-binding GntR family transcriptional regulator
VVAASRGVSEPQAEYQRGTGTWRRSGRKQADPRLACEILADRIAAALINHEPGWRLPRHTTLARRYNVSTAEVDVALDELAARHLIRRLPDGQLYRASPMEYLIPLEGVPGLGTLADPMGGQIVCESRQAALREVPNDIGWALRVPPADKVGVIHTRWTASGEPAAFCTTYMLREIAASFLDARGGSATGLSMALLPIPIPAVALDHSGDVSGIGKPASVQLEIQPPSPSLARRLRLAAGQSAVLLTTRFDDAEKRRPVALTIAVFRPDLFRIVVQAAEPPLPDGGDGSWAGAWAHATEYEEY